MGSVVREEKDRTGIDLGIPCVAATLPSQYVEESSAPTGRTRIMAVPYSRDPATGLDRGQAISILEFTTRWLPPSETMILCTLGLNVRAQDRSPPCFVGEYSNE